MTIPLVSIYAGGMLSILIALFHTRFYRMFRWREDFGRMALLNRRVIYTIHLALLLLFFILGTLSLVYAGELSRSTGLALGINLLYASFWTWRLVWQFVYFKKRKGQSVSATEAVLVVAFALLAMAYVTPVLYRLAG